MNKTKKIITLTIVSLFVGVCFVENNAYALEQFVCADKDWKVPDSTTILSRIQNAYLKTKTFKAHFSQSSTSAALGISEVSSGQVFFSNPGKMKWVYTTPNEQVFLLNNKTIWFYQKEEKQLLIDKAEEVLITDLPISFVLGVGNLERDFVLKKICDKKEFILLDLKPAIKANAEGKSEKSSLNELFFLIDPKSYLPLGTHIVDQGMNITEILFESFQANVSLEEDFFQANFPQGIDVVDHRRDPNAER